MLQHRTSSASKQDAVTGLASTAPVSSQIDASCKMVQCNSLLRTKHQLTWLESARASLSTENGGAVAIKEGSIKTHL